MITTDTTPATDLSVAEKRELVRKLLAVQAGATDGLLPLAYGQQSLWFVYQLAPKSPAYNFVFAARVRDGIDVAALRHSCQALVDRHEALRTRFVIRDGQPQQQIEPRLTIDVPVTDVTGWTDERLLEHFREQADQPFELEHGPLL